MLNTQMLFEGVSKLLVFLWVSGSGKDRGVQSFLKMIRFIALGKME